MDEYLGDEWPQMPDGSDFDGTQLLLLVRSGKSPFDRDWDVNLLINEIETEISTRVVDILYVDKGSNNYISFLRLFWLCFLILLTLRLGAPRGSISHYQIDRISLPAWLEAM